MNKRSFLKQSLLATLATAVAPALWAAGATDFPEFENGMPLRKIFRLKGFEPKINWQRIRLKQVQPFDLLRIESDGEKPGFWIVQGPAGHDGTTAHCMGQYFPTFEEAWAARADMVTTHAWA